jgi:imidazolonepropionase-like amidohydrolase
MQLLREVGYEPLEAIRAATGSGADLLGIADRVGTLEPGKLADVIAVPGDPVDDLTRIRDVTTVLKGGVPQPADTLGAVHGP